MFKSLKESLKYIKSLTQQVKTRNNEKQVS